jgi:hypothetical protein
MCYLHQREPVNVLWNTPREDAFSAQFLHCNSSQFGASPSPKASCGLVIHDVIIMHTFPACYENRRGDGTVELGLAR